LGLVSFLTVKDPNGFYLGGPGWHHVSNGSRGGYVQSDYGSDAALPAAPSSFLDVGIDASENVKTWKPPSHNVIEIFSACRRNSLNRAHKSLNICINLIA